MAQIKNAPFSSIDGLRVVASSSWAFGIESEARSSTCGWQANSKHLSLDSFLLLALALKLKDALQDVILIFSILKQDVEDVDLRMVGHRLNLTADGFVETFDLRLGLAFERLLDLGQVLAVSSDRLDVGVVLIL